MMDFHTSNELYETWLRGECDAVEADLRFKHKRMRKMAFTFPRATFFRWAGGIESVCSELQGAPAVLGVGTTGGTTGLGNRAIGHQAQAN